MSFYQFLNGCNLFYLNCNQFGQTGIRKGIKNTIKLAKTRLSSSSRYQDTVSQKVRVKKTPNNQKKSCFQHFILTNHKLRTVLQFTQILRMLTII